MTAYPLTDRHREMALDGYREIAEIMGCPVDTVKTRMFHARRRLGRLFTGTLDDWL